MNSTFTATPFRICASILLLSISQCIWLKYQGNFSLTANGRRGVKGLGSLLLSILTVWNAWQASASRSMPPVSAFQHLVSQSGTGAFRYRTGSSYSGIGMVPASAFLFIPVPDWLDAGQSDIPAFKKRGALCTSTFWWLWKGYAVHVQTAGSGKCYTLHVHRQLLMVLFLLCDIEKSNVNAGMPEGKVSPASAILPVVSFLSPVSAFRHHGSIRYRWSRISPTLPSYVEMVPMGFPNKSIDACTWWIYTCSCNLGSMFAEQIHQQQVGLGCKCEVLTYIEYRAVSSVFRTIDPPPPLHPASVSSHRTKGGGYALAGRWGGGGSIFRKTPDIGLASYSIIPLRLQVHVYLYPTFAIDIRIS